MSAPRIRRGPGLVRRFLRTGRYCMLLCVASAGCGDKPSAPVEAKTDSPRSTSGSAPAKQVDRKRPVVRIETNLGAIRVRLDAETCPGTVQNFLNYVDKGFYKDVIFHYVEPGKMIVGGGYSADYQLKPAQSTIRNEADKGRKNVRGTIAMARDAALIDSASSQFFINLEDAARLDYQGEEPEKFGYCVFGDVIEGLEVADKISQSPTENLSQKSADLARTPKTPVVISAVRVEM